MSDNLKAVRCPSCGAPLDIPKAHERYFKCGFCGTAIEDESSPEEQDTGLFRLNINPNIQPTVTYVSIDMTSAKVATATAATATAGASIGGSCLIIFIVLITLGIVGAALYPIFAGTGALAEITERLGISDEVASIDPSGLAGRRVYHFSPVTIVEADNDSRQDVILVAALSDDTDRLIYLDFEAAQTTRWLSEPLPEGATYLFNSLMADSARIYLTIEAEIFAFNRSDGTLAWTVTVSDEIQPNICRDCLQVLSDQLAILTVDGNLQVLNAETGIMNWSHLFNETPRQIVNFGGRPAVLDNINERVSLQVFDLVSGQVDHDVVVECPSDPFPDSPQTPSIYDTVFTSGDGEQIYFAVEQFGPACVQRWDGLTGEMVWQSTFTVGILRRRDFEHILVTNDYFFIGDETGVYSLDLASGEFETQIMVPDFEYLPLAYQDGILIVQANITRGTGSSQIWAVDIVSDTSLWALFLTAEERLDALHGSIIFGEGALVMGLTPDGVTVIEAFDDPNRLLFQTAPFEVAESPSNLFQLDLLDAPGSMRMSVLDWQADQVWLAIDGGITVYDVYSGDLQANWPGP